MVFIEKTIVIVLGIVIGYSILVYTEPLVRMIGKSNWAENHLGAGGTYTMWKIIGFILPIAVIIYTFAAWK